MPAHIQTRVRIILSLGLIASLLFIGIDLYQMNRKLDCPPAPIVKDQSRLK